MIIKNLAFALGVTTILGNAHSALAEIRDEINDERDDKGIKVAFAGAKENLENPILVRPRPIAVIQLKPRPIQDLRDAKTIIKEAKAERKRAKHEAKAAKKRAKHEAKAAKKRAKMIR